MKINLGLYTKDLTLNSHVHLGQLFSTFLDWICRAFRRIILFSVQMEVVSMEKVLELELVTESKSQDFLLPI